MGPLISNGVAAASGCLIRALGFIYRFTGRYSFGRHLVLDRGYYVLAEKRVVDGSDTAAGGMIVVSGHQLRIADQYGFGS